MHTYHAFVRSKLEKRRDKQIMALEMAAVLLGMQTFSQQCKEQNVRIWIDNTGGEGAFSKGASKSNDHNMLSYAFWLQAARDRINIHINRVDTKVNIADDPSRGDFEIMNALGAEFVKPIIPKVIWNPENWAETLTCQEQGLVTAQVL